MGVGQVNKPETQLHQKAEPAIGALLSGVKMIGDNNMKWILVILLLIPWAASADDITGLNVFTNGVGNTIDAVDMNANFTEIDTEVSENDSRIDAHIAADGVNLANIDDGADVPLAGEWLQVDSVDQAGIVYRTDAEALSDMGAEPADAAVAHTDEAETLAVGWDLGTPTGGSMENMTGLVESGLDADVGPVDGDWLQYDSTGANFTWRDDAELASDVGINTLTTSTAPASGACDTGDMWLETDTNQIQFCTDGATDTWGAAK